MKRVGLALVLLACYTGSLLAYPLTVTTSGTFSSTTPSSTFTTPNGVWSVTFNVASNPAVTSFVSGNYFIAPISNFVYTLNGTPVNVSPVALATFNSADFGLFNLGFLGSSPAPPFPTNGLELYGPQMYTGPESSPTIVPGTYFASLDSAFVSAIGYQFPTGIVTISGGGDPAFQVRYGATLGLGESYIDIANDGAMGAAVAGPGFGTQVGNICANVYAFDPSEELIACCSCLITPDQTVNLGITADLTSKTLTGVVPTSVTVKILSTLAGAGGSGTGTVCNNSAATGGTFFPAGLAAWGTSLHAQGAGLATTETPFTTATLSAGELASITGRCAAIIGNASGFGICTSCRSGALGGTRF